MGNPVVETDILVIGSGPAGLAFAIHYMDLARAHNANGVRLPSSVLVLEKGGAVGDHTLSGAIVNPAALRELLPEVAEADFPFETPVVQDDTMIFTRQRAFRLPFHPPYMSNRGNSIVTLGKLVRWMSRIAESRGVEILTGMSAQELLFREGRLAGIRTNATGIDARGNRRVNYQPPTDVHAKLIILADGARGNLTRDLVRHFDLARGSNPQVYSLGVKEVWDIPEGAFQKGRVVHSLGYPLALDQFGGGFIYGLSARQVAIGVVSSLDIADPTFDTHRALQMYKAHPFVTAIIRDGKLARYGAKTIPEGGLFALPRLCHDNVMIVGDAAGFLAMPSLKGVHLAMRSGMLAARAALDAFRNNDTSRTQLVLYEKLFRESAAHRELHPVRNFRQGFARNLVLGGLRFGVQLATGGRGLSFRGRLTMEEDRAWCARAGAANGRAFGNGASFDKRISFDKETALYFSGTRHDEEQPPHIRVPRPEVCEECIEVRGGPCQYFCPAQVFEIGAHHWTGRNVLTLHSANCIHCKTCDIRDPFSNVTWSTPYGGDGPKYRDM
ncbi:MAG: 4Fe-4S dicluster domain-containing protein [Spirochaetia bacterium]